MKSPTGTWFPELYEGLVSMPLPEGRGICGRIRCREARHRHDSFSTRLFAIPATEWRPVGAGVSGAPTVTRTGQRSLDLPVWRAGAPSTLLFPNLGWHMRYCCGSISCPGDARGLCPRMDPGSAGLPFPRRDSGGDNSSGCTGLLLVLRKMPRMTPVGWDVGTELGAHRRSLGRFPVGKELLRDGRCLTVKGTRGMKAIQ